MRKMIFALIALSALWTGSAGAQLSLCRLGPTCRGCLGGQAYYSSDFGCSACSGLCLTYLKTQSTDSADLKNTTSEQQETAFIPYKDAIKPNLDLSADQLISIAKQNIFAAVTLYQMQTNQDHMDLRFGTTTFTRQISERGLELLVRGAAPDEAFADAYQIPDGEQGVVNWQLMTTADGRKVLRFDTYARDAEGNTLYMVQRPFQIDVELSQAPTGAGVPALVHVNGWKEAQSSNQE